MERKRFTLLFGVALFVLQLKIVWEHRKLFKTFLYFTNDNNNNNDIDFPLPLLESIKAKTAVQSWLTKLQQVTKEIDLDTKEIRSPKKVKNIHKATDSLDESGAKRYAYAYVLAGVNPAKPRSYRGILFGILVAAQTFESYGSKADVVVLVQMDYHSKSDVLPEQDAEYLNAFPRMVVHYIPRPSERLSFYTSQFDKFRILELTQYSRVIYMDADCIPVCSLDYLFHMSEQGIFKENMLLAGNNEPSNGGFMMLRPRKGDFDEILRIIEARDAHILATSFNHTFDVVWGWGHVITPPDNWRTQYNKRTGTLWDFTTAYGNQGLMFYWTKYVKKSVSIVLGNEVDNWAESNDSNETFPVALQETLVDAIKGHECPSIYNDVKPSYTLMGQMMHFWGKEGKPWMLKDVNKEIKGNDGKAVPYRIWFHHFEQVKKRLNITHDIHKELRGDPSIGSWTSIIAMRASLDKKHAYAFLLVDVDPGNPITYLTNLHRILAIIQILEFHQSRADVVVMVQMTHSSNLDQLPPRDVKNVLAYSRADIHYLPKATRPHTFHAFQFLKFHILELTRYRRVLYMDTDIMPLCSLDYLFFLSEKGTLKENMVVAGDNEPAKRGFMMLRPGIGEYERLMDILHSRDDADAPSSSRNLTFDVVNGWGHTISPPDRWRSRYDLQSGTLWNFSSSFGDQGLLYHWVKYVKKSVSLFIGNEVENWAAAVNGDDDSIPVLESTLVDVIKGYECPNRTQFLPDVHTNHPYDLQGQFWHFNQIAKTLEREL